eukprot:10433492-Prorocentrum_lima.AAC.1
MDEGTYFVGHGCYILEVLERFSSSMHYKTRNTPGEPESFSKNKHKVIMSKNNSNIKEEQR